MIPKFRAGFSLIFWLEIFCVRKKYLQQLLRNISLYYSRTKSNSISTALFKKKKIIFIVMQKGKNSIYTWKTGSSALNIK